jgi:hypothetical protein
MAAVIRTAVSIPTAVAALGRKKAGVFVIVPKR